MLFDKLSPPADFISKIQSNLQILMSNVLYLTHEVDQIKKIVKSLEINSNIQKQVDDYFDETSPQTEIEDK